MIRPGALAEPALLLVPLTVWQPLQSPDVCVWVITRTALPALTWALYGVVIVPRRKKLPALFTESVCVLPLASVISTLSVPALDLAVPLQSSGSCALGKTVPAMA